MGIARICRRQGRKNFKRLNKVRPRSGTIGSWTLATGTVITEAVMRHRWQIDGGQHVLRKVISLNPSWASLTKEEQSEVMNGKPGDDMRQRIFMIECNMGLRRPPYKPEDIWLNLYLDMGDA